LLRAIQELEVHQVELEIQNEELRRAQREMEEARDRYAELYEFAPIAYLTLDAGGDILEFNRMALELFKGNAAHLRGVRLGRLVESASSNRFVAHLHEARNGHGRPEAELEFRRGDGTTFCGHIVSEAFGALPDGLLRIRCAILDVSARRQAEQALRASEREVLAISEREQRRIGADLHDNLGQWLTATEFLGTALREQVRQRCPDLAPQCDKICANLREAVSQARTMSHGLVPVCLDLTGLMDALAQLAEQITHLGRAECRFVCPKRVLFHHSATATHVFRIAQEAVNNALKHGRARRIEIRLEEFPAEILLRIEDDGGGFEPRLEGGRGMGLSVMRHRARVIGARLEVDPGPGRGVVVECRIPGKRA
jgi:two-component system CheB/CheR fusion protein